MQLSNSALLQHQAFINNSWVSPRSGKTFKVVNPSTKAIVSFVADCSETEALRAIGAADKALGPWKLMPAKERGVLLHNWYALIMANTDDLAMLMTAEQGKPYNEARGEVAYGASFIDWFAEEGRRMYGDIIPSPRNDRRIITIKQPIGVVAAITPWNFPIAMITRKAGAALAAGCTMVLRPASLTPLCALALAALSLEAGIPPGVFNVIPSTNSAGIGQLFTSHPLINKISFTGSTAVGKKLMAQSASTLKKLSLELGGNAPLIIFDDADVAQAVKGAVASKYRNAGQTCVCANRLYVQKGIYLKFMRAYRKTVSALHVGDGMQKNVQIGPLINSDAIKKVKGLLDDAVKKGASVTLGGNLHAAGELFFEPTIIENCTDKMRLSKEEIFGPVSAIYTFSTEEQAIALANNTPFGLAAYFFSENIKRVWRVAEQLQYGIVGINEGIVSHAEAPFGGIKESGFGREGSKYGLDDYVVLKYLCMGGM